LGTSDLVLSLHLIPESWSSDDNVSGEYSDSVKSWFWVWLRWALSTNDPVLLKLLF
jgi:hypothetical protein